MMMMTTKHLDWEVVALVSAAEVLLEQVIGKCLMMTTKHLDWEVVALV